MEGIITIRVNSDLTENEYLNLDEELREFFTELGLECEIDDEQSGAFISVS